MRRVLALVLLLSSCSKKEPPVPPAATPSAPSATAPSAQAEPAIPAATPMPEDAPATTLSLSANGSTKPTLFKGLPLTISSWSETDAAPALEVRDPSGAAASWPLRGPTGKSRRFTWDLSGEQTAGLAAGSWTIRAPGAQVEVVVQDVPAAPTEAQRRSLFQGRASALLAAGKTDAAAALAREEQARAPKDPNPWILEGDALRQAGKNADAAARYREALRLHRAEKPPVKEPPVFLLRRLAEVQPAPFEK